MYLSISISKFILCVYHTVCIFTEWSISDAINLYRCLARFNRHWVWVFLFRILSLSAEFIIDSRSFHLNMYAHTTHRSRYVRVSLARFVCVCACMHRKRISCRLEICCAYFVIMFLFCVLSVSTSLCIRTYKLLFYWILWAFELESSLYNWKCVFSDNVSWSSFFYHFIINICLMIFLLLLRVFFFMSLMRSSPSSPIEIRSEQF